MDKIVIDAALLARIRAATGPVELVDEAGKVAGVFNPSPAPPPTPPAVITGANDPFTEEEVREGYASIARGERGITTAELLTKLRNL